MLVRKRLVPRNTSQTAHSFISRAVHLLANCDWQHTAGVRQGIQFMLADMATNVQAARLMTWWSAKVTETGRPFLYESSMAKNFASDVAMQVTTDAVQIFGGYGYIREYPVEKLFRDAKITQIYEGTNQIQKLVVAGQLLK